MRVASSRSFSKFPPLVRPNALRILRARDPEVSSPRVWRCVRDGCSPARGGQNRGQILSLLGPVSVRLPGGRNTLSTCPLPDHVGSRGGASADDSAEDAAGVERSQCPTRSELESRVDSHFDDTKTSLWCSSGSAPQILRVHTLYTESGTIWDDMGRYGKVFDVT